MGAQTTMADTTITKRFRRGGWLALVCLLLGTVAAHAREGVQVGKKSSFSDLVSAEAVEQRASEQYLDLRRQATDNGDLVADDDPQARRLQQVAQRLIPFAQSWNPRAREWTWEVSLIDTEQINAFCMPGGKIVFFTGLLDKLALTDDELAMIMGHEVAHALREHMRERMAKAQLTQDGARLLGTIFVGVTDADPELVGLVAREGANLLTLKFSRENESDADLVGLELAARAGYDPHAAISLWRKMQALVTQAPPQWLSTHPSGNTRTSDIQRNLPDVLPLYERADKPAKPATETPKPE